MIETGCDCSVTVRLTVNERKVWVYHIKNRINSKAKKKRNDGISL